MSTFSVIKLKNLSPIHVGMGRETTYNSAHTIHSDTLSAALAAMRVQIKGAEGVKEFMESFRISSAFPFWKEHLYLPKPQGRLNITVKDRAENQIRKTLKGIQYIENTIWNKIVKGEEIEIEENQIQRNLLSASIMKDVNTTIFQSQVNERVSVPRADKQEATPFFFEWDYYNKDAGLYVLTDAKGELFDEIFEYFSLLGEQGIGTDKNVGGGKFVVEKGVTLELGETPGNCNAQLLLSLFIPDEQELKLLNLDNSTYSILLRGGFMAGSNQEHLRHLHKKSIYMFSVGSVFKTNERLNGRIVDLRPEWNTIEMHPVFRSGRPLSIPIKIKEYE